jgi:hypothetical protein
MMNSTRLHRVGGPKDATWLEEVIYSMMPSVGSDLHERASDPCTLNPNLRVRSGTPK